MIPPNQLAHREAGLFVEAGANDVAADGAALGGVQPTVRPPPQTVDNRMRILHAEARQMHDGIGIGHIVAVLVGIEQKIGRVQDPQSAPAADKRGGDIEALDEDLMAVETAVAVGVFVDADAVRALGTLGRRFGNFVINRPPEFVLADHFQTGGIRVLAILHHPQSAALVEVQKDRLANGGFGKHLLPDEIIGNGKCLRGFLGRQSTGVRFVLGDEGRSRHEIFESRDARDFRSRHVGPLFVIAGAELPIAFEDDRRIRRHQHRGFAFEPAPAVGVINANRDRIFLARFHIAHGDRVILRLRRLGRFRTWAESSRSRRSAGR